MSLVVKLYTLGLDPSDDNSTALADISDIAMECKFLPRHNMAHGFEIRGVPAGDSRLTDTTQAFDEGPNLRKGDRKLVVWEDGDVIFHGRVWIVERTGDGTQNLVTITAFNPWMELGFESDDRAGRPVRDADGNFITPDFGDVAVSGPQLVLDVLTNSLGTDDESGPSPGEGPLPIHLDSDNFDVDVPPNVDLNPTRIMSWPMQVGDFLTDLVNTGVVDIRMVPIDPDDPPAGASPYAMVEVHSGPDLGTDRHSSVHFDYWTGAHNAIECRHVEDFSTINNKLYDYLGPPISTGERFPAGNITPSLADDIVVGLADRISASRARYGTFMQIRITDTDSEDPLATVARPLLKYAWGAEQGYRIEPRDTLFITPAPGGALYDAPSDFDVGDLITVNVGSDFGLPLAATQRVYGYDKTWSPERVVTLGQLLTSADPS